MNNIKDIIGIILIASSLLDAWKYIWQARAIIRIKLAKGHSRKFVNAALFNDVIKMVYGIVIRDIFITISSLLALGTISFNFYVIYLYYPYRQRGLWNFKRPNILIYFINSLIPNRYRKKL